MDRSDAIWILIMHPSAVVRRGLRSRLSVDPSLIIVGEASSPVAGLRLARRTVPDVLLVNAQPGQDGWPAELRAFRDEIPGCRFVLIGGGLDAGAVLRWTDAGAVGFVSPDAELDDLLLAIRAARGGCLTLSGEVARIVLPRIPRRLTGQRKATREAETASL